MKRIENIVKGTKCLAITALCVGLSGVAGATPSLINYQIGDIIDNGSPDSSKGLIALNEILAGYDAGNMAGTPTGYTPNTGISVPSAPLGLAVALPSVSWSSGDSVTGYNYLVARFGNVWEGYDITGLTGDYVAPKPSGINGEGLDHAYLFDIGDPGTGVPDGGATVGLLGLGLTGLSLIRRKMK